MVKARKYVVKKHFQGLPKRDDFEIVEQELPPLLDGEILLKTEYISVDPYIRALNSSMQVPYDQFGCQVATVQESKNADYPVGIKVVSYAGWCDYFILNPSTADKVYTYKMPDLQGLATSLGVGAISWVGATAYFGFLEICQPKPGETVVVTAAAGAVGSLVGQIAKIKGCKVIGFAGSDEKVAWLENDLNFNKAFNYKTVDVAEVLKQAAPKGIDCYFDNVGGELSSIIMSQMNEFGRVSVCGSISSYNEDISKLPKATILQPSLVFKQLKMEGFLITRWGSCKEEAFAQLIKWIKNGELKAREHITEGFDKVYDAFVGMLTGENFGKAVVKF